MDWIPLNPVYADLPVWKATDTILAEHTADKAVSVGGDREFALALTELFMLRAQIFNHHELAATDIDIERQTRDAIRINPDLWPEDVAGAAITVWKNTVTR